MGDNGQGSSNGGGGGTQRKPSNQTNLSVLQALARKNTAGADQQLADEIEKIVRTTKITKSDQDKGDTQKFFNATGMSDRKPKLVKTEMDLEDEINAGNQNQDFPYYIFHGDMASSTAQADGFVKQFQGKSAQYISSGRLGDGTYFTTSPLGGTSYLDGRGFGQQSKAILNSNAKVVDDFHLSKMISLFQQTHPKAYTQIMKMQGGKNGRWGGDSKKSVFATLFGYNAIIDGRGPKAYDHYVSVFDRSALTVVTGKTTNYTELFDRMVYDRSPWQYTNPNEN